jgi:hypothetical protein
MKEILFPKELELHESVPIILEGVYGGTAAGLGMMAIGAFFSPEVSTVLVGISAVSTGFVTTIALQEKIRSKAENVKKAARVAKKRKR